MELDFEDDDGHDHYANGGQGDDAAGATAASHSAKENVWRPMKRKEMMARMRRCAACGKRTKGF